MKKNRDRKSRVRLLFSYWLDAGLPEKGGKGGKRRAAPRLQCIVSTPPVRLEIFGPQMALVYRLNAISQGPKNSQNTGPNPLTLPLVMDKHASKTLCTGL
jgi:hypothetical protein